MPAPPPEPPASSRAARKEGEDARERLLGAGLRLFAQQGYTQTSTRELAEVACVNVASISYYFGDKAGLYRAVFFGPVDDPADEIARFAGEGLSLAQALAGFYEGFLAPLREGMTAQLCMKLRYREMLEPTGLWDEEVQRGIKPMHDALVAVLARHLGVAAIDDDLHRLVVCLSGLAVHLHVGRDVIDQVAPALNAGPDAVDRWIGHLVTFGLAMVEAERQRRAAALPGSLG